MRDKSTFHFKQFSISHARSTMKVGTDAVLIGAWAKMKDAHRILDIGTGSGTIALMLAQRSMGKAVIHGVEIENIDALQAEENFQRSPWASALKIYHTPVQQFFSDAQYDLIVSNPPYFMNSQRPPDEKRQHARHTITLSYQELINAVLRLISAQGTFNVILPFTEGLQFLTIAQQQGLWCTRKFSFKTRVDKPIERWLMEFSKNPANLETGELVLYHQADAWSEGYKALTKEFYLKL